jgi:hypothetical protein
MTPIRPTLPKPPRHLAAAGRALFRALSKEYAITDAGGLVLLVMAAECADRMAAARVAIAEHGEVVLDRYKQARVHPACQLEQSARGQLLQAIKLLGLDVDPETLKKGSRR